MHIHTVKSKCTNMTLTIRLFDEAIMLELVKINESHLSN